MVRSLTLATLFLEIAMSVVPARRTMAADSLVVGAAAQLTDAELEGDAPADESLPMSLTLQLRNRDELEALLAAQQQPGSPQYHRWLSPDEFRDRFAPRSSTYDAIAAWLREQGFTVRTWNNRTRIDFTGPVGSVERSFSVRMHRYRHRGRLGLANSNAPRLPARFAPLVQALRLNTLRMSEPVARVDGANGELIGMAPLDFHRIYNVSSVLESGIDGNGQTIAIVARSDFDTGDVALFRETFQLGAREPVKAFPGSNPGIGSPRFACAGIRNPQERAACLFGEEAEVLLDIEFAAGMAPGATVLIDISDSDIDVSLADVVSNHPEAKIVSVSFSLCERSDPTLVQIMQPLYAQAAAQGQTVLVAAGNSGADGCGDGGDASVNSLASPAVVTSVGGTALDPGFDDDGNATTRIDETVWNDENGSGGGGVSTVVTKPAYQDVPGVPADGFRDQPDVAFMASPSNVGYLMFIRGEALLIGGTSAATPSWAGIVALANHAAGRDGSGAINSSLYLAAARQYRGGGPVVFRDIVSGNNSFNEVDGFMATPGFDLASGLGVPDVAALVAALASPECTGDCNADGRVTIDELVLAVNVALDRLPMAQCQIADRNADGQLRVDELILATDQAINGCP